MERSIELNLKEMYVSLKNNEILLPDFQRRFTWEDVEKKQKCYIASVLAKLPLGNILLVKGNPNAYKPKSIGIKSGKNKDEASLTDRDEVDFFT